MDVKNDLVPVLNGLYCEYGRLIERLASVDAAAAALVSVGKAYGIDMPANPYGPVVLPQDCTVGGPSPAREEVVYAAKVEELLEESQPVPVQPSARLEPPKPTQPVPSNGGKPPFIDFGKPKATGAVNVPKSTEPAKSVTATSSTVASSAPAPAAEAPSTVKVEQPAPAKPAERPPVIHPGLKEAALVTPPVSAVAEQARRSREEGEPRGPKGAWLTVEQFKELLSAWNPQINTGGLSLTDIYQALRTRGCRFGYGLPPTMDLSDSNTVRVLSNHLRHEWVPGYPQHCQSLQRFSAQGSLYKLIRDKAEAAVHFAFPEMAKAKMGRTLHYSTSGYDSQPLRTGANSPFADIKSLVR